jgi:hypothetical protein
MFLVTFSLVISYKVSCYKPDSIPYTFLVTNENGVELHVSEYLAELWFDFKQPPCVLQHQLSHIHPLSERVKYQLISAHKFRNWGVSPDSVLTDIIMQLWYILNIHGNSHIPSHILKLKQIFDITHWQLHLFITNITFA